MLSAVALHSNLFHASTRTLVATKAFRTLNTNLLLHPCRQWNQKLTFSTSAKFHDAVKATTSSPGATHGGETAKEYIGPLTQTFRRLKIFSLASFGLATSLSPFMLLVESNLPTYARISLLGIALSTSGVSTALVSWCAHPYVITLRRWRPEDSAPESPEVLEMTTNTLFLRPRTTTVYDPLFLAETRRPMAQWELARQVTVPLNSSPKASSEETVAETRNEKGEIIGRWVVKWGQDGVGTCQQVGTVVRYFNVHHELLS